MSNYGYAEGEACARSGCEGKIVTHPAENCSCHISPPCSACTSPRNFCPECDWEECEDPAPEQAPPTKEELAAYAAHRELWKPRTLADLDRTKIDWINRSHSNSSMIKEGVFPIGTDAAEVRKCVDGTFGGRFEYFDKENGKFKYIAYTD